MNELSDLQQKARAARRAVRQAEQTLYQRRNLLRRQEDELLQAQRLGEAGRATAQHLQGQLQGPAQQLDEDIQRLAAARDELKQLLQASSSLAQPWELVEDLSDHSPFLLLPVRIETRFMKEGIVSHLYVRIFPDDAAVHTHEEALTAEELAAGNRYWDEVAQANQKPESEQEEGRKGAWRALAAAYDGPRAAWIACKTNPQNSANEPGNPKLESWSEAPRSYVMPDQFVVMLFSGGQELTQYRTAGNPIAYPLKLGPKPDDENEFKQEDGKLVIGEDIAWVYDFEKAEQAGMAVKIQLAEPHARVGFERLLVLGLRLSSSTAENQVTLAKLLDNHHYSGDGMSLVPQGTPTNNADKEGSGYSSSDPSAEISYAVEAKGDLFTPLDGSEHFNKKDGQRLAEALGVDNALFQHIRFADREDVREALAMNRTLWPVTLGYYLDAMIGLEPQAIDQVRDFFTHYVSGRGPLPAIRVGAQPYGVLVTSDFAKWEWQEGEGSAAEKEFFPVLLQLLGKAQAAWQAEVRRVPRIDAGGDSQENFLKTVGLQPTSAEFYRRRAVSEWYIWNYGVLQGSGAVVQSLPQITARRAANTAGAVGAVFAQRPRLLDLLFFGAQDAIPGPLVDDIPANESEKWSESKPLPALYALPDPKAIPNPNVPTPRVQTNYIGWLLYSDFNQIKLQCFNAKDGTALPIPRPLLYRLLRGALLQAYYDATIRFYKAYDVDLPGARIELPYFNITVSTGRTFTRWEYMEAKVNEVFKTDDELKFVHLSVARYLQQSLRAEEADEEDSGVPERVRGVLHGLHELHKGLGVLLGLPADKNLSKATPLPTARLERLFVEHLDLCTYRLDAWQTACFYRRLQPPEPIITDFTANPNPIDEGQSTDLSWGTVNTVERLILETGSGEITEVTGQTSTTVSPSATTVYTLTASNRTGTSTARVTVTVNPPAPVIKQFDYKLPENEIVGIFLFWEIDNPVDSLILTSDAGLERDVTGLPHIIVVPTTPVTFYTLTARNTSTSREASRQLRYPRLTGE